MGLTAPPVSGILGDMTTTHTTTTAATGPNFRKNSDEVGQVWIGDGTISETEALALAATVIPNDWEARSAEYHGISWVILAAKVQS